MIAGLLRRPIHRRLAAVVTGLVLVLTQPPYSIAAVLIPALAALYWLWWQEKSARSAFLTGWLAGTAYFGVGLIWIAEAFLVQPDLFAWMIPIAMPLLAGGLALFWGAGFAAAFALRRRGAISPLALACCWMIAEAARGFLLTGFPWALLGYAWVELPPIQSASLVGINGVTLLTLLSGCLAGAAISHGTMKFRSVSAASAAIVLAAMWSHGIARLPAQTAESAPPLRIGLIQPNVAQEDKWAPELRDRHLRDLLEATASVSERGAQLVLWPEAATPFPLAEMPQLRETIAGTLAPDGVLLAGGIRISGRGSAEARAFNSVLAIDATGALVASYDKEHLVPFGEYLPFDAALSAMGLRSMITLPGGFTHGSQPRREIMLDGLPPLGVMICYEAIFADEIAHRGARIAAIVHVTNDGWFGKSSGPFQHLAQTRVRAIERGVPILRAANTGVSAIIDPFGRIEGQVALGEKGTLFGSLPAAAKPTVYHSFEEISFAILLFFLILATGLGITSQERDGSHSA